MTINYVEHRHILQYAKITSCNILLPTITNNSQEKSGPSYTERFITRLKWYIRNYKYNNINKEYRQSLRG